MSKIEIPRNIDDEEVLVRLIKSPFHFDPKKEKPLKAAFTPSSKEEDRIKISNKTLSIPGVSLVRLNYTDADTCKKQGQKIVNPEAVNPAEAFVGVLLFKRPYIDEVCEEDVAKDQESKREIESDPVVVVRGTPMDDSNPRPKYVPEGIEVYTDTPGLPMHADLVYNFPKPEKGKPNNPINMLAKAILAKSILKLDSSQDPKKWGGEELIINK